MATTWREWICNLGRADIRIYSDRTPEEKLYRHHRIARTLGWLWLAAAGLMASSMVEILLGHDGWLLTISCVIMAISSFVCLITAIPGIASGLWVAEIDRVLILRGLPIPEEGERETHKRARLGAKKFAFYFVAVILASSLIHAGILHRPR